ncbi:hypothetical protein [Acinetobacter indicus]|uniref:hypothetical protein n=1 Tax=Acinetobacter indicus TaxID=756892 RepID=UPI0025777218|nr:hypothetical protein [Acinetobacter indicus]MDM1272590.1 hypothetical protein [Acinetobacter indicus]
MKLNLTADLAVLISIITVFLFANGNAYLGGYLSIFNIDPIILNYSIQDKIYIGYLKGFNTFIYAILVTLICMAVRFIWIAMDLSRKINNWLDRKLNTSPNNFTPVIHNSSFHEELERSYSRNASLGVSVMIILIVTLFILADTEKNANQKAVDDLNRLAFDTVSLKSSDKKDTHKIVLCGSTLCAVIDDNKRVTLEEVKNIIFYPKK